VSHHPIAITGMHRSGTSMITRGLHESGLHLLGGDADALLAAADDNPEGFWENKAIVNCNDDLLEASGGAWDNPPALLPQAVDDPRLAEIVEPATAALAGLAENDRWGFKDPRLCLTAAFWLDLQPDLRFVICVRNPLEVALSLKRRNQNSYSLGLTLWEQYYQSILDLVPPEQRIITHYDSYFIDPAGELGRVCDFAGLEAATLAVRSDLRHHDVGVSLDEANLGGNLRSLYQSLCDEAGAMAPRSPVSDEGQVRRLVLDGTVAARHAEQRQQAIGRLEERLIESQGVAKDLRDELNAARRESETAKRDLSHRDHELAELRGRVDQLTTGQVALLDGQSELRGTGRRIVDTTDTIADLTHSVKATSQRVEERQKGAQDKLDHIDAILGAVHVKLRAVEDEVSSKPGIGSRLASRVRRVFGGAARRAATPTRRVVAASARRGVPAATKTAKQAAKRMPAPMQNNLRRVRGAVADGQVANRIRERGAKVTAKLPAPAQKVARKSVAVAKSSGIVPKFTRVAKGVNRRLPNPAKKIVNRLTPKNTAPTARPKRPVKKAAPAPRPKQSVDGRASAVPKGPAAYKWQKGYERIVDEFVLADAAFAVVTPGCKSGVERVDGRVGIPFPSADVGSSPADCLSLIAILEAARLGGCTRLVVPEGARGWLQGHPEFRDHLIASHSVLADREAAGIAIDLESPAAPDVRSLLAEVNDVAAGLGEGAAVLDWTADGVGHELPGITVFSPPVDQTTLPYFDRSIDVVVVSQDRDLDEARRVTASATIVVRDSASSVDVVSVESMASETAQVSIAVCAPSTLAAVDAAISARAAATGSVVHFDVAPAALALSADVVVSLAAGVVPLPGAIAALANSAAGDPTSLSVAKVLDAEGRLESAGSMVFADGSTAGIGAESLDVRAPWHEFARPVCFGEGAVAAVAALWTPLEDAPDSGPAVSGIAVSAAAWAGGHTVTYRPKSVFVRAVESGQSPTPTWEGPLPKRPNRPEELRDGAWRFLLANDDPTVFGEGN
jgi:hypothetical protein